MRFIHRLTIIIFLAIMAIIITTTWLLRHKKRKMLYRYTYQWEHKVEDLGQYYNW